MKAKLDQIREQALAQIKNCENMDKLNEIRVSILGKKGELTSVLKSMKDVAPEDRPKVGQWVNETRQEIETVMDEARTEYYAGKVNNKFQQFADDYGFKVQPCIAGHPHTKAKVEAPMKILDEIRAYNGKLNYIELVELVTRINNRVNTQVNQGTGRIPLMYYNKEKAFLNSLPADNIRKPYQITTNMVKVNHSSMFNYKSCQLSILCTTRVH